MINRWLLTGDCHGDFSRFRNYNKEIQKDPKTAIIILGDAGLNYTLQENDSHMKNYLSKTYAFRIYCVRGNHEARPQDVPDMKLVYDEDVAGEVYMEEKWPKIRYFKDYGIYQLGKYRVGVIGGAYSVDKWYRLERGAIWFDNEQLDEDERANCKALFRYELLDFMFTHTAPLSVEPTDLFLGFINQDKVDKTMEIFLQNIREETHVATWCFGHYHADRIERPYVEQFFKDTENLDDIRARWHKYFKTRELDWWLVKSPNFYMEVVE